MKAENVGSYQFIFLRTPRKSTTGDRLPTGRHDVGSHDARVPDDGGLQGRAAWPAILVSRIRCPEVGRQDGARVQEKVSRPVTSPPQ